MEPPPKKAPQGRSPSRPSFLAPTKASLARSNPEILERALSRSPTRTSMSKGSQDEQQNQAEPRGFGLRDRKALRPSLTIPASPTDALKQIKQSPVSFTKRRASGLGAFAAPPRRVSRRISALDFQFQSPTATRIGRVEPSIVNTPEDQLASELGSATGAADMDGDFDEPSLHDDGFEEPDLPPTPTQLGLERPPGRPKGLLSSSPGMQQGKWGERRAPGGREQSPSKLRTVDYGAEPEDLARRSPILGEALVSEPVQKKRKLKQELSSELETLKQDVAKLEGLSKKLDRPGDNMEPYWNDLISLLISTDPTYTASKTRSGDPTISALISTLLPFSTQRPPKPPRTSPQTNPFALSEKAQTESYLSAFAPLNLTTSSSMASPSKPDLLLEQHKLTLSAPRPFPPKSYDISVSYETNPETQSLVSLSAHNNPSDPDLKVPSYLQQWINTRLNNPLLRLDVSGLCWGINRYWEALISRARLWAQIEEQHATLITAYNTRPRNPSKPSTQDTTTTTTTTLETNTESLTTSDLRYILPHLQRTSMLFESREKSLRVIVSCELTLDEWTSEPELLPSICVSTTLASDSEGTLNYNPKAEQESKKLFQAILTEKTHIQPGTAGGADAQAITKATQCVLNALFGEDHGKGKGKER
ncbi:hypothetical protein ARAM_002093 [Aspergillus rambellii]|uniref:Uncharacterized protein n=1 Tax=Aspergillus rambellii TaxID=308745 RepID=A0A0F8UE15_9EURO|nr:hypothetical protein ARAM_002093 [Aspergillus rambellii]